MDRTILDPTISDGYVAKPQKAFAVAFAVLALGLAGCASGLGAHADKQAQLEGLSRVEDGTLLASQPVSDQAVVDSSPAARLVAYTVKLRTGELATIAQAGTALIAAGTPVLVEYGARNRIIPQNASIGY